MKHWQSACLILGLALFAGVFTSGMGYTPLAGDVPPRPTSVSHRNWNTVSTSLEERALGLEDRMVQIRFPHPQSSDQKWTAASGTLVLRSNVVLTAAHTFYSIEKRPGGQCRCAPRLPTSGPDAISGMQDLSFRLYRPGDGLRTNEVGVEKAFPDNHCRFVKNVGGKCMIPPEHDFVAMKMSGFLLGGKPLQTGQTLSGYAPEIFHMAGFPTELEGETLVASACHPAASPLARWNLPTTKALSGPSCDVGRGMSGGPVARQTSLNDFDLEGIVLAAQKDRVIYRMRDEQVDRCIRAAAAWDANRQQPESILSIGFEGAEDCPVIER